MGEKLVSGDTPTDESGVKSTLYFNTYTECFEEILPFYLSIGMTYEQFWNGDVKLVKYYRKADKLRQARKNEELWLQGAYIYEAILDASPILHAFAKNGTKPLPYPDKPFELDKDERERKYEKQRQNRLNKLKEKLLNLATKKVR